MDHLPAPPPKHPTSYQPYSPRPRSPVPPPPTPPSRAPPPLPPPRHHSVTPTPPTSTATEPVQLVQAASLPTPIPPPSAPLINEAHAPETPSSSSNTSHLSPQPPAPQVPQRPPLPHQHTTSDSDSDLDGDSSEEDELYEDLASEIARRAGGGDSEPTPSIAESSFERPRSERVMSGLRRRVFTRRNESNISISSTLSEQTVEKTGDEAESEEAAMRRALDELEDVEIAQFIERVGKRVTEVRVGGPKEPISFPERTAFVAADGTTDWRGFGTAYFHAAASTYVPASLLAPPRKSHLSLSGVRQELERYYVLVPPSAITLLIEEKLAAVYRWESPDTKKYCILYSILWLIDYIPALPFLLLLYHLLRARLFPPTPSDILAESRERIARSKEAQELSDQLKKTSRVGFAVEGARHVLSKAVDKASGTPQGSALARGLGGSALVGGLAGGLGMDGASVFGDKGKKRESAPPSALARAMVGGSAGLAGGIAAPGRVRIIEEEPTREEEVKGEDEEEKERDPEPQREPTGELSLYRLLTELARIFGPPGQDWLTQGADGGEKIKNILLHPDHPSVTPVIWRLVAVLVVLLVVPTWIQIKSAWLYLGLEFFVLWRLRELFPEYRKALLPVWWLLLGAPTDAEFATWVLQKRRAQNRPLRGKKTIKRMKKRRARGESVSALPERTSLDDDSASIRSTLTTASRRRFALSRTISRASSIEEAAVDRGEVIASHFAVYQAAPGTLILTSTTLRFVHTRGFRTVGLGLKKLAKRSSKKLDNSSDSDSDDENSAMDIQLERLASVKKETRYGFEGLSITERGGGSWKLSNVARRDEIFNKILSYSPASVWQS